MLESWGSRRKKGAPDPQDIRERLGILPWGYKTVKKQREGNVLVDYSPGPPGSIRQEEKEKVRVAWGGLRDHRWGTEKTKTLRG